MTIPPAARSAMARLILPFVLICTACTPQREGGALSRPSPPAAARPWWDHSGDAALDHLVGDGAAPLACARAQGNVLRRAVRIIHGARAGRAEAVAQSWERAGQRLERAQAIALAYARARAWQTRLEQRLASPAMLKDNAEIAHFRREAGLVPGLDEDMAGIMLGLNGAAVDAARVELAAAIADLARVSGQDQAALGQMLEQTPAMGLAILPGAAADDLAARPDLRALAARRGEGERQTWAIRWAQGQAKARAQIDQARADLANAQDRARQRADLADRADKALTNARLAYRNGAAGFATLFAAEAAGLATREERTEAQRGVTVATIRLWTAQGQGETPQGGACD